MLCYETDFKTGTTLDRLTVLQFPCHYRVCSLGTLFQRCSNLRCPKPPLQPFSFGHISLEALRDSEADVGWLASGTLAYKLT